MTRQACPDCHAVDHHDPACPQMRFTSGRRRDDAGDVTKRAPRPSLQAVKVRVFVPSELQAEAGPARTAAGTWAYLGAGMATPVIESVRAIEGGHLVDIREAGDVAARAAALLEKG